MYFLFRISSFVFIVKDSEGCQDIYRIIVKDDVKFENFIKEEEKGFEDVVSKFWTNEIVFSKGSGNVIEHTIVQDASSGKEKGNKLSIV